jgi:hypothetical protein
LEYDILLQIPTVPKTSVFGTPPRDTFIFSSGRPFDKLRMSDYHLSL